MKYINSNRIINLLLIFLICIFLFQTANFHGIILEDTISYMDIEKNGFNSNYVRYRPILYPFVLKLSFLFTDQKDFTGIVTIQMLSYILASYLFLVITKNNLNYPRKYINFIK